MEDTSLEVEGLEVGVNIRWLEESLGDNFQYLAGRKAEWRVFLGLNDGEYIHIYEDSVKGILEKPSGEYLEGKEGFGFDGYFKPEGSDMTLSQLSVAKKKDYYSARKRAVDKLLRNKVSVSYKISSIPKWNGSYQHEE